MPATIEQRLEALECEFRRSRRINCILTFAVVAIVCIAGAQREMPDASQSTTQEKVPSSDAGEPDDRAPQGSSITKADGFSVHDADERGRLHLALLNGNFPVLGISQSGQNGPPSIEMTATDGSRSFKIHNEDGYPLFSVFAADNGQTSLNMRHPEHERTLQITSGPQDLDGPAIRFFAPAKEDGTGGLLPYLQLGLHNDRQPHVRIVDNDGKTLYAAPTK